MENGEHEVNESDIKHCLAIHVLRTTCLGDMRNGIVSKAASANRAA